MTRRWHHLRAQARLAWHVFRGRPLAYRLNIYGGAGADGARHVECTYHPSPAQTAVNVHARPDDVDPEAVARAVMAAMKSGRLPRYWGRP